jgi:ABC-type lipoprotein release transport system permease subunit
MINTQLASRAGWNRKQTLVLRVAKPSWLPRDTPFSSDNDSSVARQIEVDGVVPDAAMGRFSLQANQVPPPTIFVPLSWLQQLVEQPGRANILLLGGAMSGGGHPGDSVGSSRFSLSSHSGRADKLKLELQTQAHEALRRAFQLDDADLELRELTSLGAIELRSRRVFLDPPLAEAIQRAVPHARGVLSYFVNELRHGDRATPYSMVTAMQGGTVPDEMNDDEILLNSWLAEDLQARPGGHLELRYFVIGPAQKLEERTNSFRVRAIVPLEGAAADPDLMPNYPGLHDTESCRDWDAGIPIDFKKIRDKDEKYWEQYRGTPKAFLTLNAGQQMWSNRFGNLTALRFPSVPGSVSERPRELLTHAPLADARGNLERNIRDAIDPASVGLFFQPVREQALAAARQSMDFGQLFLGFSLFLIVSALILTGLLFTFGVEQRSQEIGTLLALGWTPRQVRRVLLCEGLTLSVLGALLGVIGGIAYAKAALWGLKTIWRDAISGMELHYHAEMPTLLVGVAGSVLVCTGAIWLNVRRHARRPARELLAFVAGTLHEAPAGSRCAWCSVCLGSVSLLAALAVLAVGYKTAHLAVSFFVAGALLLVAGVLISDWAIARSLRERGPRLRISDLAIRNVARRRARSLAVVCMLACGTFVVFAVGSNWHGVDTDPRRSSGTGGFDYYAESAIAIPGDLNDAPFLESATAEDLKRLKFVRLRLHEGDDASCLNLNRAQQPRLLGVNPTALATRAAFQFHRTLPMPGVENPWLLLDAAQPDAAVPAIADVNTVKWALGKSLGATLDYTDERGRKVQIRIVGILENSILQGSLVISERNFQALFPSESGYRVFLMEFPVKTARIQEAFRLLGLQEAGWEMEVAWRRLFEFNKVENAYILIFESLGGLGLLLGMGGMACVVLRNVWERRSELAILQAMGFRRRSIVWLVVSEHWNLVLLGLASGMIGGIVAVWPVFRSEDIEYPNIFIGTVFTLIFLAGLLAVCLATLAALRGPLLHALRNE